MKTSDEVAVEKMDPFSQELARELESLRAQGLSRTLRRIDSCQGTRIRHEDQELLNFSSNDYLGLANQTSVKDAAAQAALCYGAGAGASRLVCGSLAPHHELEEELADFKGTEAALGFSTGYAAALGAIGALVGKDDVIILDRLAHACMVDAARLSGAKVRVFAHNDLNYLEQILAWARKRHGSPGPAGASRPCRILIVTESVFSMDGDQAPLRGIVDLKERYGAWLMLDEAHATGLFGPSRRGVAEAQGVCDRVEVQMGTLGKAIGASGGYICGSRALIDLLVNRARSFIFSTAPAPSVVAAAKAGVCLVRGQVGAERCRLLWQRVAQFLGREEPLGLSIAGSHSPIIPLVIGEEGEAVLAASQLQAQGLFVPGIRYPAVPRGQARLRVTLTADHREDEVARLRSALALLRLQQGSALIQSMEK